MKGWLDKYQDGGKRSVDLRLPNYEKSKPSLNPYAFYVKPTQDVHVLGLGAHAQGDINDRLNLSGGLHSASVKYPGGNQMFMKPEYHVGVKYNFEDGGTMQEHQENYNDSAVSYPPGFVGMGNNTKGRNYSPAWGGQFQKGGTLPPIYTEDPRKVRAYQDSLGLSKSNFFIPYGESLFSNKEDLKSFFKESIGSVGLVRDDKLVDTHKYQKGIQPVDYADFHHNSKLFTDVPYTKIIYKKPVQPYILQQEPSLKKKVTKAELLKSSKANTPGVTALQHPDVQLPSIQQGKYRVEYYDPSLGEETHRGFMTQAESDAYANELSNRNLNGAPSAGNITQRVQYAMGGDVPQAQPGITKKPSYEDWYKTVPREKNDTSSYNLRRAYELAPQEQLDAFTKDPEAHLVSVYENPQTGIYEFMKSKHHPTIQKELDWFNSKDPEAKQFRKDYKLDTSEEYYKYIPKHAMGGSLPGSVGFTYARTRNPAPSEGPYAKKTLPSAQDGGYFQNYMDQMNQDYKNWYSGDRGHDDGFDSYFHHLKDQAPVNRVTEKSYLTSTIKDPESWNFADSIDDAERRRINQGKMWAYPITQTSDKRDTSMDEYNSTLTKYLAHKNASKQENGGMTYYQNGLDWKPKSISKNGGWLEKYTPQAQAGDFILPRYDMPRAASESTSRTFTDVSGKQKSTATTGQKKKDIAASTKDMGNAKRVEEKEEAKRIAERKSAKAIKEGKAKTFTFPTGESKSLDEMDAREKAYVTGKSIEGKGRFNEDEETWYDEYANPLNWISEAAGAIGTAPYESKLYDSNLPYIGAIVNPLFQGALGFDPLGGAMKVPSKVAQSIESGVLSNTYKLNPWAFKPNESNWYRQVGKSAIDDALETGVIREAGEEVSPRMFQEFQDQLVRMQGNDALPHQERMMQQMLASRRPASPFFGKGELFYPMGRKPTINKVTGKLSKNPAGKGSADYLIETALPNESFQPAYVKAMGLGVPTETGATAILKPDPSLRNLENFNLYKKDWLRGYKEVPRKEEGGVIEDDMGQWAHPGKITKINSNQITMKGVPYPVLGISDSGDQQMMYPEQEYTFKGKTVTEYPQKKKNGGWLEKYN